MDILDRLLQHDAWTTRQLLVRASELSDEQLDREFEMGHRTLRRTFAHVIGNMECWYDLMAGVTQRPRSAGAPSVESMLTRLDIVAEQLLALGRQIVAQRREDDCFSDVLDTPPQAKTFGGGLVHVATHGMHHRAQCLYMLRRLGMPDLPEGDALSWEHQQRRHRLDN